MMKHPVTGKEVPDPSDQKVIYRYLNPRPAEWPEADYVVSNPPFIGNARMREALGDGYSEILRKTYKHVPETVDYVMYWWHKAAELIRTKYISRFGFITTNSISQVRQRKVLDFHLTQNPPIRIDMAIPNHPWVDDSDGAAVRIAMTLGEIDSSARVKKLSRIGIVLEEGEGMTPEDSADQIRIEWRTTGKILGDLSGGADVSASALLKANSNLSSTGVKLHGSGFILSREEASNMGYGKLSINNEVIKPYRNGRDLTSKCRDFFVIDFDDLSQEDAGKYLEPFQRVVETVKPEREINRDRQRREFWWRFGRSNQQMRQSLKGLKRYIATPETAKHRIFVFLDCNILPDNMVTVIGLEDAYFLGVLSSKIHITWALAAGGRLGVGNDPRYNKTVCFDPFPFPDPDDRLKQEIRELGERLDAHRKRVQAAHPDITITGMYNLLEKLRAGQPLTDKDREYNNRALVSTLKQIHDELDTAVLDAYGWPHDITDEQILERLVALNAERAAEERNGHIRWLRPDYQAPATQATQTAIANLIDSPELIAPAAEPQPWPTQPKAQLAAIRDLLRSNPGHWSIDQIAAQFKGKITDKRRQTIRENLDRLEWFGLAIQQDNTWHYAAPSAIA
jgi:hypothetical protein